MSLKLLLEENQLHDYEFGMAGANHVPMTLIAMNNLGASLMQMENYLLSIKEKWSSTPFNKSKSVQISESNWQNYFGDFNSFPSYVDFFQHKINEKGIDNVLHQYLDRFITAPVSAAYHPMIRLCYGLEEKIESEIVYALAYWAITFLPSPSTNQKLYPESPESILSSLVKDRFFLNQKPQGGVRARIQFFLEMDQFKSHLAPLVISKSYKELLEDIYKLILKEFEEKQHFTLLHGVTSCHALRVLLPYIKDKKAALTLYWYSVCGAYLTVNNVDSNLMPSSFAEDELSWSEIKEKAIESKDEHAIKLAYTCLIEEKFFHNKNLKRFAQRELIRFSPVL